MNYRVVWSLLVARIQESGAIDLPLSPEDSLKVRAKDAYWQQLIQAERDPYLCHPHEYKAWAEKRKRRVA